MPNLDYDAVTGEQFETSVRQVARRLYQAANLTGSIKLDGRERDEIIDTGTELIIIEATKLRRKEKTETDLNKSRDLVKALKSTPQFSDYNYRIILVTLDDPTADQNEVVRNSKTGCPKEIISFSTLFSRLFDARHYLRLRDDHYFGSIRNPANENDFNVPISSYIQTTLSEQNSGSSATAEDISRSINNGSRIIIYGDYGSGKSMTLRDIYYRSKQKFIAGETTHCPVYLNLREHIAQSQPDEALFRHADKVGFENQHSLIAAWRAGYIALFLDGFDELTPPQFGVSITSLKHARRVAVELVKRFMEQSPTNAPVLVAGRENYFDSREEAQNALGFLSVDRIYYLAGFDESQVARYLKRKKSNLPAWLPTRPLLLGYLANSGLIQEDEGFVSLNPTAGWDRILERVCEREVRQIWGAGFEAVDLRHFIEGLATRSRRNGRSSNGLQDSDLQQVFHAVFGRDANEPANLLAGRLPGLGAVPGRIGAREFIDADFADAAASGDLIRFIEAPFDDDGPLSGVSSSLGDLGLSMASELTPNVGPKLSVALAQSGRKPLLAVTASDLISIITDRQESYTGDPVSVCEADFDRLVLDGNADFSRVTFEKCTVSVIELGRSSVAQESRNYPKFKDCMIDRLEGALSVADVPMGVLIGNTTVETYVAFAATNNAVMESGLSTPVKVLLTMLRKLFMQRGSGRQYSALKRGLPAKSAELVEPIAALIKSNEFAEDVRLDNRIILMPNRSRSADAFAIINGPNTSVGALIEEVREMAG